jgi:hypothetical protein
MNALCIPRTFAYAFWPLRDFSEYCEVFFNANLVVLFFYYPVFYNANYYNYTTITL